MLANAKLRPTSMLGVKTKPMIYNCIFLWIKWQETAAASKSDWIVRPVWWPHDLVLRWTPPDQPVCSSSHRQRRVQFQWRSREPSYEPSEDIWPSLPSCLQYKSSKHRSRSVQSNDNVCVCCQFIHRTLQKFKRKLNPNSTNEEQMLNGPTEFGKSKKNNYK